MTLSLVFVGKSASNFAPFHLCHCKKKLNHKVKKNIYLLKLILEETAFGLMVENEKSAQ